MIQNSAPQKPIRFVTNTEGPYAKRRRINSACLTCRRRKTRCSGERPICQTCIQNKHECGGYGNESPHARTASNDKQDETSRDGTANDTGDSGQANREQPSPRHRHSNNGPSYPPFPEQARPPPPSFRHMHSASSDLTNSPDLSRDRPDGAAGGSSQSVLSLSTRNRMPYFRYFGPTAIMPGFKQMVVKVKGKQQSIGNASTSDLIGSPAGGAQRSLDPSSSSQQGQAPTTLEIPIYDSSDVPPSTLITHLCQTFFKHLGCNYPFLQKERFMKDLEEKQVDAILVDAICAIAARFSDDPLLSGKAEGSGKSEKIQVASDVHRSEYGAAFAQRAKSAITDTFACPSVAYVQAALLLAYDEFGASRDSGLWMYLGIAIRMAQDLGMQTLEGLKYEGRDGPTPQALKTPSATTSSSAREMPMSPVTNAREHEQRSVERERIDSFWAVFFLDRVISSGTGRPVTLRDRDIEICFPSLDEVDPNTGWPMPFPALIRVIHLYGRVTDLLNGIKEVSHVSPDVLKKLGSMEHQLTDIYHGLSERLHFSAINFQHYAKAGQSTNFILLHIWFHTLIVLLHRPTLLKTFEGQIQQLLPNSRELSMSSAKTIADILAFAELIDPTATSGNPFTSQPIYISACAFLKESAALAASSNPQSRGASPPHDDTQTEDSKSASMPIDPALGDDRTTQNGKSDGSTDQKQATKHNLLATAANSNYQRCYRGLQSLEQYWLGVKYILTVLDQKAKGIGDPLLYTKEEMESALEVPKPEPAFTSPGWRRKLSWGTYLSAQGIADVDAFKKRPSISGDGKTGIIDGSALGWSLTGTMNSPSTNIAVLYPTDAQTNDYTKTNPTSAPAAASRATQPQQRASQSDMPAPAANMSAHHASQHYQNAPSSDIAPSAYPPSRQPDSSVMSDADLLLSLHSPYSNASPHMSTQSQNQNLNHMQFQQPYNHSNLAQASASNQQYPGMSGPNNTTVGFGDMTIQTQDIDLSTLTSEEMMPWFEYLPPEMMGGFDGGGGYPAQSAERR